MQQGGLRSSVLGGIRRHRPDYGIVLIAGLLLIVGLIIIYAISPGLSRLHGGVGDDYYLMKQLIAIGLGIIVFGVTAVVPLEAWRKFAPWLLVAAVVSSILLMIPGAQFNDPVNGATRWLQLGPLSFQPAELIKFTLLINGAILLAKHAEEGILNSYRETIKPFIVTLFVTGVVVVFMQKDMGSMMVIVALMVAMIYVAGLRMKYLSGIGALLAGASVFAIIFAPHRVARFLTFLHPEADAQGSGYHISQALIAVGSGGIIGQGLGRSVQAFGYLPEAANDSIFAVFAEKFGFIGCVLLLGLFGLLLFRIISLIERTPDLFARLLATGIFAWVAAHVLINVGAMLSLLPLKGITLPFISYGGSSLMFVMAIMGLLLQISRYSVPHARMSSNLSGRKSHESSRERGRNRRPRYAGAGRYS